MATQGDHREHFVLQGVGQAERYTARGRGDTPPVPPQDRATHAAVLRAQFAEVAVVQRDRVAQQVLAQVDTAFGLQVEFESVEGIALAVESLANAPQGIELMNVRQQGDRLFATVFIPDGKLRHFERLLADYESFRRTTNGARAYDHQRLIDAIRAVRVATFESLWTDAPEALPADDATEIWWEAWLPASQNRERVVASFRRLAQMAGLATRESVLHFPERSVVLMHGSRGSILQSAVLLTALAELRRAKDTAQFFDSLPPNEQVEWVDELGGRLQHLLPADGRQPHVTLLDTGVNIGHPLLARWVDAADLHTLEPAWGVADDNGHGTQLAGLGLLGDLTPLLAGAGPVPVLHRLESVKILRQPGDNQGESYGDLTAEAVARVEVTAPERQRVFTMAVTASDGRDRGRPSSWSSAVDRLVYNADEGGTNPRLFVLSAGNTRDQAAWAAYPASLSTNGVQDPAQAWNALTVGAYTQLTTITAAAARQYRPIAAVDTLSPFTTTSATWQRDWPFKPDVVMEGGNAAVDGGGLAWQMDSLSLLTTCAQIQTRLFDTCWATSAATALAAKMSAEVWAQYPELWPETVRGLMVHSARWTDPMLAKYVPVVRNGRSLTELLRHCGYGVPSLERALWSASNSLTLIVQDELQPFEKASSSVKTRDMHLHDLPWPEELLRDLGGVEVKLRVTLSYFIEPNPGERGGSSKYGYQSHALRFAVRRPTETTQTFRRRVNAQVDAEEQGMPFAAAAADRNWFVGEALRRRGSLLSDTWTGTAADLANLGQLAVYPAMGWWRDQPALGRHDRSTRYALLVSIEAPEIEQDLYAAVRSQILVASPVEIVVGA